MRNSQIVLLSGLGVVMIGVVALVIGLRVLIGHAAGEGVFDANGSGERFEPLGELGRELENFDGLIIRSAWDIELQQGEEWYVEIDVDEDVRDRLNLGVSDGKLVLDIEGRPRRGWFGFNQGTSGARIMMPDLRSVDVQGAANIELGEFHGDSLTIVIAGAANIESLGGEYEDADLVVNGAANVELSRIRITNANVILAGAANIELTMNGGELTGDISGFGRLSYGGDVSLENVRKSGFSTIEHVAGEAGR